MRARPVPLPALLLALLPACASGRPLWVESVPAGARVQVDGLQQGARTPARIQTGASLRRLTLQLANATISATLGDSTPGTREPAVLSSGDGSLWVLREGAALPTLRGYFPSPDSWYLLASSRALIIDGASCDDAGVWRIPPGPHRLHGPFGEATLNADPGFVLRLWFEASDRASSLTGRLDAESLRGELQAIEGPARIPLLFAQAATLPGEDVAVVAETRDGRRATLSFRLDPRARTAITVVIAASAHPPARWQ